MAMVSQTQSENLNCAPLQFPTMVGTDSIVKKTLKIKIASKRIEAECGTQLGKHNMSVAENKSGMDKLPKFVLHSSDGKDLYPNDSVKMKSSAPGSHKRGSTAIVVDQKDKKRKMDRGVTQQCSVILKTLMTHPAGWVFNQPVDPVKLGIPDYFSIITEPMDLGTVKAKLGKHEYFSIDEFAADVKLTFSNAMRYNPPGNNVHLMAKELNSIFCTRWKCLGDKRNRESEIIIQKHKSGGRTKNNLDSKPNCLAKTPLFNSLLPKRLMSAEEKQTLREELLEILRGKVPQDLRGFLQKFGLNFQKDESTEVDIGVFDEDTLWELKRVIRGCLASKAAKAESSKATENVGCQLLGKIVLKGINSSIRSASDSAIPKPPPSLVASVASKCGSCGGARCHCSLQNDSARASESDLSDGSLRHENRISGITDKRTQNSSTQMRTSDVETNGAAHAPDEENVYSSPQHSPLASTAVSGEGWTPVIDVRLSPKKALRAAMLKSRFADTILKAQHKTLLDHGDKVDPVKMQQEKERLERLQREEKARIEAQIKAAEVATRMRVEAELKLQREKEREAARLALQKMERTVQIDNLDILKDLELLSQCSPSDCLLDPEIGSEMILAVIEGGQLGNPLERLGLFMKDDYLVDEDEDVISNGGGADGEEGEIYS